MKTLFMGDMSATIITNPLFRNGDVKTLFTDTVSLFEGNDVNFVNLECAITESDKEIKKFGPALKAVPETAGVLKSIGVNCCGLSNNHFFDFGIKGAEDTLAELDKAGIAYTGFGKNYEDSRQNFIVEKDGDKLCIIAVCEHEYSYALSDRMGCRPFDEFETIEDIRKAKAENDKVVVIYHGGKEHCLYPSPRLMRACRAMARNGADVVLCQHSHCIGCYEEYQGCHILYGQGNFHFVKEPEANYPKTWKTALAVKYDTKSHDIEFVPITTVGSGMACAKGDEKEEIMTAFQRRNQELQDGSWQKGWHEFCVRMQESYESIIKKMGRENSEELDRQRFGHYIDCEAHLDVWRELFPTYNQTNER